MPDRYFDEPVMQRRQVLLWAVAARRQLDRWEPLVIEHLNRLYKDRPSITPERIWQGEAEHHFAIVAFDHMLEALKLWPNSVVMPPVVRDEMAEVRDLATHWIDNMPIFNSRPRPREPTHNTGKAFAARNPKQSPFNWWSWNSGRGALLTPHVSASDAREAIRAVQEAVLAEDPELAPYVPPKVPPAWLPDADGNWWPPAPGT